MEKFKPVQKRTLSSEMVERILTLIHSRQLQPGDRLPSVRELCEAFGVGRSSVREAVKILETSGLVRTSTRGMELCSPPPSNMLDLNNFADKCVNIRECFEARRMIEMELAGLAAERATPADIALMRQALTAPGESTGAMFAGDIEFHRALINAAHNSVLSEIYNSITGLIFQNVKYYMRMKESRAEDISDVLGDHLAIITGIEAHDVNVAKRAMRAHIDRAERLLLASLDAQYRADGGVSQPRAGGSDD